MNEQQHRVAIGILFAIVLGLAINWWWPWGDDKEAYKDDKEFEVGFSVNVGVDAHVRYGEPAKSPSRPTPTRIPFLSVDLRNYGISPTEFLNETSTGNRLQFGGLDLLLTDDVRNYITTNEDRSDYLLIFLSEDRRRVERFKIIRNKEVLRRIDEDDIDDITTSSITDKYGNIFYIPLFTKIDDVERIYVIDEYIVYSRSSAGVDVSAVIGIIGLILLLVGVVLLLIRIFSENGDDIGCLWFIVGAVGALLISLAVSLHKGCGGCC